MEQNRTHNKIEVNRMLVFITLCLCQIEILFVFIWIRPGCFNSFFRLNEEHFTFNLHYKHSGTFANRKYEELSYPKKSENVRPHYSQSSRENATPSSGTSPLASYKEVHPPGHFHGREICWSKVWANSKQKKAENPFEIGVYMYNLQGSL